MEKDLDSSNSQIPQQQTADGGRVSDHNVLLVSVYTQEPN